VTQIITVMRGINEPTTATEIHQRGQCLRYPVPVIQKKLEHMRKCGIVTFDTDSHKFSLAECLARKKQMGRRYAARIDRNQPELVEYIRALGASFQHTHQIPGCLDGIVGYLGIDQRVEIKDSEQPMSAQKLTKAETETFATWKGRAPIVITTKTECRKLLKEMYSEAVIRKKVAEV